MAKWQDRTEKDIAAWWTPADGKAIIGEVVGMQVINSEGKPRAIWVIETHESTMARLKGEEVPKEFPAGTIIGVGHRAKLRPIAELYATTENFDVAIQPNKQVNIGNGRKMWLMNVKTRGGNGRPVALAQGSLIPKQLGSGEGGVSGSGASRDDDSGDDDIPF